MNTEKVDLPFTVPDSIFVASTKYSHPISSSRKMQCQCNEVVLMCSVHGVQNGDIAVKTGEAGTQHEEQLTIFLSVETVKV